MKNENNNNGNGDKLTGLLERLARIEARYGAAGIMKGLLLLFVAGVVMFAITNPRYIIDKVEKVQNEKHGERVKMRMRADSAVRLLLHKLLQNTQAGRVWLIELHNGGSNLQSGLPFLYGDMRMEECAQGVEEVSDEYTNFSLSRYPFIEYLFAKGIFVGTADSLRTVDEKMYYRLMASSTEAVAALALYMGEKPLGIVGASWCGDVDPPEDIILTLRKYGVQISTLLCN